MGNKVRIKNFNDFASAVAETEGLKKETSIGNIREVLSIAFQIMIEMSFADLIDLLHSYIRSPKKERS